MLSDVMTKYGFEFELKPHQFFETNASQSLMADLKAAFKSGQLFAVIGEVGVGKTATIESEGAFAPDCSQNRACGSAHGSSTKQRFFSFQSTNATTIDSRRFVDPLF